MERKIIIWAINNLVKILILADNFDLVYDIYLAIVVRKSYGFK
jgi:hypothetical protein